MLFRPDDSKPLDFVEDEEWFEMQSMGRTQYVLRRTISVLINTVGPVALPFWALWWAAPQSRPYLFHRFTWIALAIGVAIVGSLGLAHAFDTWRSYEKRSELDDEATPMQAVARLSLRASRLGLIGATLSTATFALEIVAHGPAWLIALMGGSALLGWRSVYFGWRMRKTLSTK